jgi:hypothetical protein
VGVTECCNVLSIHLSHVVSSLFFPCLCKCYCTLALTTLNDCRFTRLPKDERVSVSSLTVVFVCTCVHVFVCTCVHVFVCTCVHVFVCTCVHVLIFFCLYLYAWNDLVCICARVCVLIVAYTCIACIDLCTYITMMLINVFPFFLFHVLFCCDCCKYR